jgi:membrane protease YdiL (CAAX protease family)
VAIPLGYALFTVTAHTVVGINYDRIAFTATSLFFAVVLPATVGAAILTLVTSMLGWWPRIMRERLRLRPWLSFLPATMALIAVLNIDYGALPALGLGYLAAGVVAALVVGYSEELLIRGLVLVGFRPFMSEAWAWFWSSATFGALHILTALAGRALPLSLAQAGATFFIGTVLYLARRATGSIIPAMLLHAAWDFALFTEIGALANGLQANYIGLVLSALLLIALSVATIVAIAQIARGEEGPEPPAVLAESDQG